MANPKVDAGWTAEVLEEINTLLNDILWPILLGGGGWVATLFAVLALLQWHVLPGNLRSPLVRTIGKGALVLQIYYFESFHTLCPGSKRKPFVLSCVLIFLDTVVLWKIASSCEWAKSSTEFITKNLPGLMEGQHPPADLKADAKSPFKNIYMLVARPFRRAVLFFIAQGGLMSYYVFNLDTDAATHNVHKVSLVKWMFAIIITAIVGEDETGSTFQTDFWEKIVDEEFWSDEQQEKCHYVFTCIPISYLSEWKIRRSMDWLVNSVFRSVLLGTAPIMLCVEDPLDFIKDCLAIFFIASLDDYDDSKSVADFRDEAGQYDMDPDIIEHVAAKLQPENQQPLVEMEQG